MANVGDKVLVPDTDTGELIEGVVVYSRPAIYKKPSFMESWERKREETNKLLDELEK